MCPVLAKAPCSVCGEVAVARNLCGTHYKRFMRHGHTSYTRPETWGKKGTHPLLHTWESAKRYGICEEWLDFWVFVSDVGERPDGHHFRRIDKSKPFSKENVYWKPTKSNEDKAAYARAWRKANPLKVFESTLKRYYNMTYSDYEKMLAQQDSKCAICKSDGPLVVDHCHKTGVVRGLLCNNCNSAMGLLHEDKERISNMINYLNETVSGA